MQAAEGVSKPEAVLNLIIVDDDPDIRRGLAILLRSHGHQVTVFESAELYLANFVDAHCAILDVALSGMSGLELHERLRASGRRLPVVFITAHVEPSVVQAVRSTLRPLLKKPLVEDDLIGAIASVTAGEPSG